MKTLLLAIAASLTLASCSNGGSPSYHLEGPKTTSSELDQCLTDSMGKELSARKIVAIEVVRHSKWIKSTVQEWLDDRRSGYWVVRMQYEVTFESSSDTPTVNLEHAPPGTFGWSIRAGGGGYLVSVPHSLTEDLGIEHACGALVDYVTKPVLAKLNDRDETSRL